MHLIKNRRLGLGDIVPGTLQRYKKTFYEEGETNTIVCDQWSTCLCDPGEFWLKPKPELTTVNLLEWFVMIQNNPHIQPHEAIRFDPQLVRWMKETDISIRPMFFYIHRLVITLELLNSNHEFQPIDYNPSNDVELVFSFTDLPSMLRYKLTW